MLLAVLKGPICVSLSPAQVSNKKSAFSQIVGCKQAGYNESVVI